MKCAHSTFDYVEGIIYFFTEVPLLAVHQEENNVNLNNLLHYVFGKKYSHHSFVGEFNFGNIKGPFKKDVTEKNGNFWAPRVPHVTGK